MGKRADVVIVTKGIVFVVEFKVGATTKPVPLDWAQAMPEAANATIEVRLRRFNCMAESVFKVKT